MYSVIITSSAEKDLRRLDRTAKNRITTALLALADDPRPIGCIKIRSEEGVWRIRIGDYRVGYRIDDEAQTVTVIRVGHHRDFYD
jgi:mRNA interferase RelE/StbE